MNLGAKIRIFIPFPPFLFPKKLENQIELQFLKIKIDESFFRFEWILARKLKESNVKYWVVEFFINHNRRCILRVPPYFFDCDAWEAFSWSSSNLISGAHQKATSTAALSEVRHQLTGAIVQEKRKTYSLARETLQTRRHHNTVSENQSKCHILARKFKLDSN